MEPLPVTPPLAVVTPPLAVVPPLAVLASFPFPEVVVTPGADVTVLPVPVWVADWALLFEFPLLFDPLGEGILVVTKETNWFYLCFSNNIQWFGDWAQHKSDRNIFKFSGPAFIIFCGMKFLIYINVIFNGCTNSSLHTYLFCHPMTAILWLQAK